MRAFCRQYGLLTEQIYYVPSKKHYCKESRATYSSFLIDTKPWSGHRILSDAARFFHWKGEDFFEELGFEAHRSFIPSAHGQLSIIDGFINPWAKAGWRSSRNAFASPWETTLLLAHEILHIPRQEAAKAWERHILVGSTPTYDQVERFLFPKEGKNLSRENLWDKCVAAYEDMGLDVGWADALRYPDALDSSLDGGYWH